MIQVQVNIETKEGKIYISCFSLLRGDANPNEAKIAKTLESGINRIILVAAKKSKMKVKKDNFNDGDVLNNVSNGEGG